MTDYVPKADNIYLVVGLGLLQLILEPTHDSMWG